MRRGRSGSRPAAAATNSDASASAELPGAVQSARQRQLVSAALQEAVVGATLRCETAVGPANGSAQEETLRWSPWVGTVEQVNEGSLVVTWIASLSPALDPAANPQDWPARAEDTDEWRLLYRAVQVQRPAPAFRQQRTSSPLQPMPSTPAAAIRSQVASTPTTHNPAPTFSWALMPLLSVALDRLPSAATLAVWRSVRTAIGESVFDEAVRTLQQAPEHLAQLRWDGPEHIEASEQERALAAYEMQPSIAVFVQRVREMAAARHPCACPSTVRQQQPNFLVSQGSPQAPQGQQGAESWTARLDAAGVENAQSLQSLSAPPPIATNTTPPVLDDTLATLSRAFSNTKRHLRSLAPEIWVPATPAQQQRALFAHVWVDRIFKDFVPAQVVITEFTLALNSLTPKFQPSPNGVVLIEHTAQAFGDWLLALEAPPGTTAAWRVGMHSLELILLQLALAKGGTDGLDAASHALQACQKDQTYDYGKVIDDVKVFKPKPQQQPPRQQPPAQQQAPAPVAGQTSAKFFRGRGFSGRR